MGFLPGIKPLPLPCWGIASDRERSLVGILPVTLKRWAQVTWVELTTASSAANYQDVFAFMVLILVLVFRPAGLLGERVAHRA